MRVGKIVLYFLSRIGGVSKDEYSSLNFSFEVGDQRKMVEENYRRAKSALKIKRIITIKQIHSNRVFEVTSDSVKKGLSQFKLEKLLPSGDGIYTQDEEIALGVKVADCIPIYFFTKNGVIGIAHAGWRGTYKMVVVKMVKKICKRFNLKPESINFVLGPGIEKDCYEVSPELKKKFANRFAKIKLDKTENLDLKELNRRLLKDLGLKEYPSLDYCPFCNSNLFYSARRNKPTGRNLALIINRNSV